MKRFDQIVAQIPTHLRQYVVDQDYSRYTPVDQATWRFILRQLKSFLSEHAHEAYLDGLKKTGISINSIPRIEDICEKLQAFGWTAVPVSGFIPPAAFMEMQSLSILPIASDMRSLDHILYTPAPDIVHEAAGHAPILVDPQFADYLKQYAKVAKKALISSEDLAQYEAIRDLSDIKEDSRSTRAQVEKAEKTLNDVNAKISHISEAALLGRMNWWTAEYGLIGELDNPKIFGAGLLSSVGEARECLSPKVQKVPLTVDCVDVSYDITEPQPQLFVAKSFSDLSKVLKQLEDRLAFRVGGREGLERAIRAATVNTVELNSGLQISGKLTQALTLTNGDVYYYKFDGPTQLCEDAQQIPDQGGEQHPHGFSSPLGFLKDAQKCLSEFTASDLKDFRIELGHHATLSFQSGVVVDGEITGITRSVSKKIMIISFNHCTVKKDSQILFAPDWGTFDMAVGHQVVSVFAGPADRESYGITDTFVKKVIPRKSYSAAELRRHAIYQAVRDLRDKTRESTPDVINELAAQAKNEFSEEWLVLLEMYELTFRLPEWNGLATRFKKQLESLTKEKPELKAYIDLGLALADQKL